MSASISTGPARGPRRGGPRPPGAGLAARLRGAARRVLDAGGDGAPVEGAVRHVGWSGICRLGLVQTALGAIVVLTTTTINRVMVVELALPALLPGLLVGLHFAVQVTRPRMGHGSDVGRARTPWIVGGMALLALCGTLAAVATAVIPGSPALGIALAVLAFAGVGLGVGAAGTSLLVLLAAVVRPALRGVAATTVWIMMIAGFVVTTIVAADMLEPYSHARLVEVTAVVSVVAFVVACLAVAGVERRAFAGLARRGPARRMDAAGGAPDLAAGAGASHRFLDALAEVWAEPAARRFTIFVFVSMLAYSAQDLVLEPWAGAVHGATPAESTRLSGSHHAGVLVGLVLVALAISIFARTARRGAASGIGRVGAALGSLRTWTYLGCAASALALVALAASTAGAGAVALAPLVIALGLGNGLFAAGAIGSMMALVGDGAPGREGVRMGLWGAAQAIAFAVAGIAATATVDLARALTGDIALAYASVFAIQILLFTLAAFLARAIHATGPAETPRPLAPGRIGAAALHDV